MTKLSRRSWITVLCSALVTPTKAQHREQQEPTVAQLALKDFHPTSMLNVPSTRVERARFPAVDFHTHLTLSYAPNYGIEAANAIVGRARRTN